MILVVDNSKNIGKAKMTPKIIDLLQTLRIPFMVVSTKAKLLECLDDPMFVSKTCGVILSGGPLCLSKGCMYEDISKNVLTLTVFRDVPILGICFGFQVMAELYGGKIQHMDTRNHKKCCVQVSGSCLQLLDNRTHHLFFSHEDYVSDAPPGFTFYSTSDKMVIGIENTRLKRYGVQFHPEGTQDGLDILKTFLKVCSHSVAT